MNIKEYLEKEIELLHRILKEADLTPPEQAIPKDKISEHDYIIMCLDTLERRSRQLKLLTHPDPKE
jgi:hypothetical protein